MSRREYNRMKQNASKALPSSSNLTNPKKALQSSKGVASQTKAPPRPTSVKAMPRQPAPPSPQKRKTDAQEVVRHSLVSVDQANKSNPQSVAVYCEKIFQRFLSEEVP